MNKLELLKSIITGYESVLVAFSGGIDSALLLKVAFDVLGPDKTKAVTAKSPSLAGQELEDAKHFAEHYGIAHAVIETEEFKNPDYIQNPENRCYHCKDELYLKLGGMAKAGGFKTICNGTNLDDLKDVRPGLRAAEEHGIKSPFVEAGISKQEVRELSRMLGLELWQKPASPCLSSRVPYGDEITPEKLKQIEAGEHFLKNLGFKIVRVRHFGKRARVELGQEEFIALMDAAVREKATERILSLGFQVVIFEPYRQGRLNEEPAKI